MSKPYKFFFALPVVAFLLTMLFGSFLFIEVNKFKETYDREATRQIILETNLIEMVLKPMLKKDLNEAINFCQNFDNSNMRISLINENGKVLADSFEDASKLDDHSNRQEIRDALNGEEIKTIQRFSNSLNKYLIYHAKLIDLDGEKYVVRTAIEVTKFNQIVHMAENNIIIAICLGILLVIILTFYIIYQLRKPIIALENSANEIASGKLDFKIEIPDRGAIRNLALSIQDMNNQLKEQLNLVTFEKEEKEKILNGMSDAVVVIDEDFSVVKFNYAAQELFEISSETSQFNFANIDMPKLFERIRKTFDKGNNFANEYKYNKFGVNYTLLVKGNLVASEGNEVLLVLCFTDLTKMRKLESFRSEFISNVSHEIKTPITSIIGAVEILEEYSNLDSDERDNLLRIISNESKRLNSLIHDILSLAALEQRQLNPKKDFEFSALDIIVKDAVQNCQKRAKDNNIELELTGTAEINSYVDSQLLEHAVINLINNAIKYSNSEKISVSLEEVKGKAVIKVIDYGIGIPEEHQKRIFERFYRVHKERSRNLGGTGLGLAIVKHAVQLHHGRITLSSKVNQGCTFTIKLPISS